MFELKFSCFYLLRPLILATEIQKKIATQVYILNVREMHFFLTIASTSKNLYIYYALLVVPVSIYNDKQLAYKSYDLWFLSIFFSEVFVFFMPRVTLFFYFNELQFVLNKIFEGNELVFVKWYFRKISCFVSFFAFHCNY